MLLLDEGRQLVKGSPTGVFNERSRSIDKNKYRQPERLSKYRKRVWGGEGKEVHKWRLRENQKCQFICKYSCPFESLSIYYLHS